MHDERNTRQKSSENNAEHPVPQYMLDRENQTRAKVLSNTIKQKRKEKAVSVAYICCGGVPVWIWCTFNSNTLSC